jgi:phage antirepressor YoqD-like protein
MNMMTQFNHNQKSMSNIDLLEIINTARQNLGEKAVRLNDLNTRIVDELEGDYYENFVVKNPNGTSSQGFNLNLDQCTLIGMRESKAVRKNVLAILKEKQNRQVVDLNNPEFLRQALLGYTEKVIELEQQVQILEPKAKVLDAIAETTNTYTIRESVKAIGGILEKDLIQLLIDRRWIYRDESKRLQPYADKVQKGIFVNKTSPVIKNQNDGQERVFLQMRVTAFGLTRIVGLVQKMKQVTA